MKIDKDAFSSGQISSKLWLCEELEKLYTNIDNIAIYGGWYGITAFLLRSRNNIEIKKIRSYDIDPKCEAIADLINENWKWQDWQFKAMTADCNLLRTENVDLIINTSCEHFENLEWFNNIPIGTHVALQGADMDHSDHVYKFDNLEQFATTFQLTSIDYIGSKTFNYPDWNFTRFMLIGIK